MELINKLPDNIKKALNGLILAILVSLAGFAGSKLGQTPTEPVILQVEPGTMKIVKVVDAKDIKEKP